MALALPRIMPLHISFGWGKKRAGWGRWGGEGNMENWVHFYINKTRCFPLSLLSSHTIPFSVVDGSLNSRWIPYYSRHFLERCRTTLPALTPGYLCYPFIIHDTSMSEGSLNRNVEGFSVGWESSGSLRIKKTPSSFCMYHPPSSVQGKEQGQNEGGGGREEGRWGCVNLSHINLLLTASSTNKLEVRGFTDQAWLITPTVAFIN